ncbi:MAG: arylsulfatase [Pseudomonadota bacterium]
MSEPQSAPKKPIRPNVVVILADDLGFADLGCMGSEIKTPVLDNLAQNGTLMSSMYNCARCCPTRASLLTGLYPHSAGVGHMGANLGTPAYQGFLRKDAATIAEHLQAAGYRTCMSGKWHVAGDFMANEVPAWRVGSLENPTPRQRGFEEFFGIIDGVTHFFSPHYLMENDTRVTDIPDDFYMTDAITDKAMGMVSRAVADDAPFFLYLAHTAPHWPLHAPSEDITKYEGLYDKGWDSLRQSRHEEMNGKAVLEAPWDISPRDGDVPPWEAVEEQSWEASKMAAYAAMVDRMDQQIGRLIQHLKDLGEFENTLIFFLSDNGGCAEFMAEDGWAKFFPNRTHDGREIAMGNHAHITPGGPLTYQSYDKPWANASNAPFRLFKHYVHEGGISTPLIAHWPEGIAPQSPRFEAAHVVDLLPTILEATGTKPLAQSAEHAFQPLQGESFLPALQGQDWQRDAPIFFEHEGNAAIRAGPWKLVCQYGQAWELYQMEEDRTELRDLSGRHAPREAELLAQYQAWSLHQGVLPWSEALPRLLAAWQISSAEG